MDETVVKIVVCGDSFCGAYSTPIPSVGERAHFSQMLEDQYGHEVINLAHNSMSNVGICFQIREAIKLSPQVIVYNQTWPARVELMMNTQNFNIDNGLKNFIYFDPGHVSTGTEYVGDVKHGNVLSTTWQDLDDHTFVDITDEQILAVKLYLKHMYHTGLAAEVDSWMLAYWRDQMVKRNIIPIKFNDAHIGKIAYDVSKKYHKESPFHTDRATQEVIAANIHRAING